MAQPGEDNNNNNRNGNMSDNTKRATMEVEHEDGPRTTLVTHPDGEIAFPGLIPRPVHSPETPGIPKSPQPEDHAQPEEERKAWKEGERPRQKSEPLLSLPPTGAKLSHPKSNVDRPRPQNWNTEGPARGRRHSLFRPVTKRAGTSYLNQAIWEGVEQNPPRDSTSSSSSSSSSDEDERDLGRRATSPVDATRQRSRGNTLQRMLTVGSTANAKAKEDDGKYGKFSVGNQNYLTTGKVKKDGRLAISVNETAGTGYLAKALGAVMHKVAAPPTEGEDQVPEMQFSPASRLSSVSTATADSRPLPRLNIVIMVIGSRGDAQPFLKIGKVLKEDYGHRVRIATHPAFRDFVEKDSGLEFFSVGGDPSELMAFMVKNPGLIPTLETVKAGDIGKRRAAMAEMFDGFWRACINATDDENDKQNLKMMGAKDPFVADVIIANPPSFAHIHCAEALGIPVHLMFTFPYTPTQAFPHPLASIKKSNVDPGYTNFISYPLVEMMVWQGLGDLVNNFRVKTLGLDPVSTLWAPGATYRMHVPFTYLWSPGLVPKPADWGSEIDIAGFVFLDLASAFKPPKELEDFLAAGEKPIYIGFGSIVVDDADRFTQMIFEAVEMAGVRALVSKGWGGLGGNDIEVPENIFLLDNTPHDWLFPKVKACVIHGGAGTTAIALKCGLPTMVVPFFGDQHFWGKMLGTAGVGPMPVPYKSLSAEKLADGIEYLVTDEAAEAAGKIAKNIATEGDGAVNAVKEFHRQLNLKGPVSMNCSILKDKIATWQLKGTSLRLSPLAADLLVDRGMLNWKRLRLIRHTEWNDYAGPGEPVTGVASSLVATFGEAFRGIAGVPYHVHKRRISRRDKKLKRRETALKEAEEAARNPPNDDMVALDAASVNTETTVGETAERYVGDVAGGVTRTARAIERAPMNLAVALTQGFHNAPRLYGDDTVRRPPRVTGFRSGLRAARAEFVYGVYDGFTGVIRHPIRGAKEDGVIGFVRGTGMGLTGFVLKNLAAIIGPLGYTLKGIAKQVDRSKTPQMFIRRARINQGQREARLLDENERKTIAKEVVEGWQVMKGLCDKITEMEKQRGLAGQIERILLDKGFLFENVEVARKALEALDRGDSLESVLNPEREGRDKIRSCEKRSLSIRKSFGMARKSGEVVRKSGEEARAASTGRKDAKFSEKKDEPGMKQRVPTGDSLAVPAH
ncbi:Fc.00g077130.m01.CDS01 [Cosmosporella sp. VM-42]